VPRGEPAPVMVPVRSNDVGTTSTSFRPLLIGEDQNRRVSYQPARDRPGVRPSHSRVPLDRPKTAPRMRQQSHGMQRPQSAKPMLYVGAHQLVEIEAGAGVW
jgi:hypothetical protein